MASVRISSLTLLVHSTNAYKYVRRNIKTMLIGMEWVGSLPGVCVVRMIRDTIPAPFGIYISELTSKTDKSNQNGNT